MKRGPSLGDQPLPRALMPGGPYGTVEQQKALRRLATALLGEGAAAPSGRSAAEQILRRDPPRLRGREPGAEAIDHEGMEIEELKEVVASLEDSYLFVQGPPGSGKTWSGARLVVDLLGAGQAGRHHLIEPQGDPQPAGRGRGGRPRPRASASGA